MIWRLMGFRRSDNGIGRAGKMEKDADAQQVRAKYIILHVIVQVWYVFILEFGCLTFVPTCACNCDIRLVRKNRTKHDRGSVKTILATQLTKVCFDRKSGVLHACSFFV